MEVNNKQKDDDFPYIRIGDTFFKKVVTKDKEGNDVVKLSKRNRQTFVDDFGKERIRFVSKFDDFCNIPSHVNYQPLIDNQYNMYHKVEHTPKKGKFPTIVKFLNHIFGEQVQMGYDYFQILWFEPLQSLPILCLVSEENETGKTTFGNFIGAIFGANFVNIGQNELSTEFNGSYASKLVTMVDEGRIDYKIIDKLKNMSTNSSILLRQMHRDHVSINFFSKFILCSNQTKDFIRINKYDERYWIKKISKFKKFDPLFLDKLKAEIPAFLFFISNRKLSTKRESRNHFSKDSLRTQAFEDVVKYTIDPKLKEIAFGILEYMEAKDVTEMRGTPTHIKEVLFDRNSQITSVLIRNFLREGLGIENIKIPASYRFEGEMNARIGTFFTIKIESIRDFLGICQVVYTPEPKIDLHKLDQKELLF